jgi:hypothetical protein
VAFESQQLTCPSAANLSAPAVKRLTYTNGETSANKVFKGKVEEFAVAQEARHEERDAQTVHAGCVQCAQDKEKPRTPFVRPNVPLTLMDEVFGGPALL